MAVNGPGYASASAHAGAAVAFAFMTTSSVGPSLGTVEGSGVGISTRVRTHVGSPWAEATGTKKVPTTASATARSRLSFVVLRLSLNHHPDLSRFQLEFSVGTTLAAQ